MAQNSFGLLQNNKKSLDDYREYVISEVYELVEHCNIDYRSAWDMPVAYRKWWISRKCKDNEKTGGKEESHVDPFGRVHKK